VAAGYAGLNGTLQLRKILERHEAVTHIVIRPIIALSPKGILSRVSSS
jgi:hypothetical protein